MAQSQSATGQHPIIPPREKVRKLQRSLYIAAKQSPKRRFHALYDRIYQKAVLIESYKRVRQNRGAPGIDGVTFEDIDRNGVESFLSDIETSLREKTYRPKPVRRKDIPKPDGSKRPLGIPTIRDRVVQTASRIVLEPVFEADFKDSSFGFRPKRSAVQALEKLRVLVPKNHEWALEMDIEKYFDTINHARLMELLERRISDRRVLKLIKKWLKAGSIEEGVYKLAKAGTPQGGALSPLLANLYLNELDRIWEGQCRSIGHLVRYADDAVVICKSEEAAKEALRRVQRVMDFLGLKLKMEKTRIANLRQKGIDFLGCHLRMSVSKVWKAKGRWYLYRWPSRKSMNAVRERIRDITSSRTSGLKREVVLERLSQVLKGWGEYFRTGNASKRFLQIDSYVRRRLIRWEHRRRGWNQGKYRSVFDYDWYKKLPLYRLVGNIRYPGVAHAA